MSEAIDGSLSLYFDLKPGEKASLEVVAQAALHWVETLRTAARAIDPHADIRVELLDANEGNLRLNTVLEWMEEHVARVQTGAGMYPRLRKLAIAAAVFTTVSGYPTYEFYFGDDTVQLSQEDRDRLDTLITIIREDPAVEHPRKEFFRTLESDPSIQGVGLTESSNQVPSTIIPSDQFPERSGLWEMSSLSSPVEAKRSRYPVVEVTLISPVLVNRKVAWKFQPDDGLPAFSAKMTDENFLNALDTKILNESLRTGIRMTLRLKVDEVKVGEVWEPKRRTVIEVISPRT